MTLHAAWQALERDDFAFAESAARATLARSPQDGEALYLLGSALLFAGRAAEALAPLGEAAARLQRRGVGYRLGHCRLALGDFPGAEAALRRETELYPQSANAQNTLGVALVRQGKHEQALAAFLAALRIEPAHAEARRNAGVARSQRVWDLISRCRWDEAGPSIAAMRAGVRDGTLAASPFTMIAVSPSAEELRRCAEQHVRVQGLAGVPPVARRAPARGSRIRLAYVSGDFHEHATAKLAARLFELHDRSRFEVCAVSYGEDDGSPMRRRLRAAFDRFIDVRGENDHDAARRIAEGEAAIAIDLKGHTPSGRPGILAARPAPVQASYLGFPGTTGAPFIDYLLADAIVVPPADERFYSERIVRLPHCYQVNDATREIAARTPSRAQAGLRDDDFVFCCFNHAYKITPEVFDVWARLLRRLPSARLWLLEDEAAASDSLRDAARSRGIDPARLVFAPRLAHAEHLARHRLADLFLDTLPCNAHTTASDALWAGLPVLTCLGTTFAGRVAASLLAAVGLPELVAGSLGEYEDLALALASDRPRLAGYRERLGRNRLAQPLFDSDRFRRGLEAAYEVMWEMHLRGEAPRSFNVAAS
jgi:predicted O-linked N-acetylglucosamine transferase (SPINDLY family)